MDGQDAGAHDAWVTRVLGVDPSAHGAGGSATNDGAADTGLFKKVKGILADAKDAITGDGRKNAKTELLARLAKLTDPPNATPADQAALATLREAINKALLSEAPPKEALTSATHGIDALAELIDGAQRNAAVAALKAKNPAAAAAAEAAFGEFGAILGTTRVTPEALEQARTDLQAKRDTFKQALAKWNTANQADPAAPDRQKAIDAAATAFFAAKAAADAASARDNAMQGRISLTQALSHGPLSAETSAPFPDPATAEKLIAAYGKNARIADLALASASTAKFPAAIADNVGPMIDKAASRFQDGSGVAFEDPGTAETYAGNLLKTGGAVGPDYFAGLGDYIHSGGQFSADGPGRGNGQPIAKVAQQRSVNLAGKLIKSDGSLDLDSPAAKTALGDILYHPQAMKDQTPALSANVLKTMKLLRDPVTGPKAGNILETMKEPTNPAAQTLVRGALGKGDTDAVDANAARQAALASMLKPLDQGPVGSCFATAPARRMRETEPLKAMQAYADIASKGTYKPPFDPEVPAVTSVPPGEDPVMRSWEYSTAVAAARKANSTEGKQFRGNVAHGTDMLKTIATQNVGAADKATSWANMKAKLAQDVAAGFTFTYDANSTIVNATDRKSSTGRYVIQTAGGADIRTQAEFEAAIGHVALSSLGIAANTPQGAEILAEVRKPAFIAAVCPGKYKPWELKSGGQTTAATQTLFGSALAQKQMLPAGGGTQPEGERTKEVLSAFLKNFKGSTAEMTTIRTVGMHGFNALPNDPSLLPLKGATDAETTQKVKANLLDKGAAVKDTALSAERAAFLFDAAVDPERDGQDDPALLALIDAGIAAHRPRAAMKPADVSHAVASALSAYHEQAADREAETWREGQVAQHNTPSATEIAARKASTKSGYDAYAAGNAKNAMIKDLGVPQFVIADSNWGDSTKHVFFVIAPDPTTGEPLLWERTEPPGSLSPAGREWVDHEWASIQ